MADYKLMVLCNAQDGQDDAFNEWYETRHLDDVLNVPGFHRAQRLSVESAIPGLPAAHRYATIYDFVSDDVAKTMGYFFQVTNTDKMPISPAMAPDAIICVCHPSGPARERDVPTPWPA